MADIVQGYTSTGNTSIGHSPQDYVKPDIRNAKPYLEDKHETSESFKSESFKSLSSKDASKILEKDMFSDEVNAEYDKILFEEKNLNLGAPLGVKRYRLKDNVDPDPIGTLIKGMTKQEIYDNCLHDFNFLSRFIAPEVHIKNWPPMIMTMWAMVVEGVMDLQQFIAEAFYVLGIPRGFAKTTLVKYLAIFAILFTDNTFILIVSSVGPNAEAIIKDICDMMSTDHFRMVFGDWDATISSKRADFKRFTFMGKDIVLKGKGVLTSVRGLNVGNKRPNLIICEDMQTEENAKSEAESASALTWFSSTLIPASSDKGCVYIYVGNTYAYRGSIMTQLIESDEWISLTLGAILSNGLSLWEGVHPISKLKASYRRAKELGKETHWLSQMMNSTDISHTASVDLTELRENFKKYWINEGRDVEKEKNLSYILVDPASQRKNADNIAIVRTVVSNRNEPVATHAIVDQMNPKVNIDRTIQLAIETQTPLIYVEGVAYQETLKFWFQYFLKEYGIDWLHVSSFDPGRTYKNTRILAMFEQVAQNDLHIHDNIWDIFNIYAKSFDKSRSDNSDDLLDTIASSYNVLQKKRFELENYYKDYYLRYVMSKDNVNTNRSQAPANYLPI